MQKKMKYLVLGAATLALTAAIPLGIAMGSDQKEEISIPSPESFDDQNYLKELTELKKSKSSTKLSSMDSTQKEIETRYFESLNESQLLELIGEISVATPENFELEAQGILPVLMDKFDGQAPDELSTVISDDQYNEKYRMFTMDTMANGNDGISSQVYQDIKTVIDNKSEDTQLRRYALLQLDANSYNVQRLSPGSTINLKQITEDKNEDSSVRGAALIAMSRVNDPSYDETVDNLMNSSSVDDPLIRYVVTSAAKTDDLEKYDDVIQDVLDNTSDVDIYKSTIYSLGISGGEEAVTTIVNNFGKFDERADSISRYSLKMNLTVIRDMLNSTEKIKVMTALKASEIIGYGEMYSTIKEISENSNDKEVKELAKITLGNIDPNQLIDEDGTNKWEVK